MKQNSPIHTKMLMEKTRTLPIGFNYKGRRISSFVFNQYLGEHEAALARIKSRYDDLATIVKELFPLVIKSVDGYTLSEIASNYNCNVEQLIQGMPLADVFTVIANLRYMEIESNIYFRSTCPVCEANNDDNPKTNRGHNIGGMDISFWTPPVEPIEEIRLSTGYSAQLFPVQLADASAFFADSMEMELRQLFFQIFSIPGLYDRNRDGLFSDKHYKKIVGDIEDRNKLFSASRMLASIGPTLEIINSCRACFHEWNIELPVNEYSDFFSGLLICPSEEELVNISFYLTFGEQAPCKSLDEVGKLPTRQRDALLHKLTEAYKRQKEEMEKSKRKGGKGSSNTEYV